MSSDQSRDAESAVGSTPDDAAAAAAPTAVTPSASSTSPTAPSQPPEPGDLVEVVGLVRSPELNGMHGTVAEASTWTHDRVAVRLATDPPRTVLLSRANFVPVGFNCCVCLNTLPMERLARMPCCHKDGSTTLYCK